MLCYADFSDVSSDVFMSKISDVAPGSPLLLFSCGLPLPQYLLIFLIICKFFTTVSFLLCQWCAMQHAKNGRYA